MATGSLLLMLLHHGGLTWSQSGSQRYLVPPKGCHLLYRLGYSYRRPSLQASLSLSNHVQSWTCQCLKPSKQHG